MTSILGNAGTSNTADPAAARGPARHAIPLNAGWLFAGPLLSAQEPSAYRGTFATVDLPHSVDTLSWRNWDPTTWEHFWLYRKVFDLPGLAEHPEHPPGGHDRLRYLLRFSGALSGATVFCNGRPLGVHLGGYLPFSFEVTEHLQRRHNRLDVLLDGRFDLNVPPDRPGQPSASVDFWQLAGLYRDVSLDVLPAAFLADVSATPREVLDPATRRVDVECTVDSALTESAHARIDLELRDGNDKVLGRGHIDVGALEHGRTTVRGSITDTHGTRLWSRSDPALYHVVATLHVGERPLHDHRVRIGFRQAEFTKDGFRLNGEELTILGLNRHQFFPYVGAAMPERVQRRDARILKDLNCDMVRCSHYPQAESFVDACDELGVLVFEEVPGWQYIGDEDWRALVLRDVREMIVRDRNHPSIVLWGVRLNETEDNAELYSATQALAKELDDSRQTTGAIIGPNYGTNDFQQDVFAYNDYDAMTGTDGVRLPRLRPPRPEWPYLVSEAVGTLSGPATYYRRSDRVLDLQGQALAHAVVHEQALAAAANCGTLGWSGFDYPSGTGNQYAGVKYTGVLDEFRVPKPGAAFYAAQVDPAVRAVIEPAFFWDFTDNQDVRSLGAQALIFANAERLEVFVAGKPYAELTPDRERFPNLRYAPFVADFREVDAAALPDMRIDAYGGGALLHSRHFASDPARDRLSLLADDLELHADGSDATRVAFRAVDAYGAPRPSVDGAIRMTLRGPATLIGDNPFPIGETGGVGAAWVRAKRGPGGHAELTAEHETLGRATVTIRIGTGSEGGNDH